MIRLNSNIPYSRLGKYRASFNIRALVKVLVVIGIIVAAHSFLVKPIQRYLRDGRPCFKHSVNIEQSIEFFPDLSEAAKQPTPGKTIFFLETSCSGDGFVRLNARQSCAIESAARSNPDWDIFVLFASPRGIWRDPNIPTPLSIEILQTYPNVHLRNIDLWTFANATPVADWLDNGELFKSIYLREHVSDLLRLLTLYKFGGTYLDLDTVVMKSLNDLASNYAGAEDDVNVCNAVLNFSNDGLGHFLLESALREFMASFNGDDWAYNGPRLIRRMLQRLCQAELPAEMTRERCQIFTVYPMETFFPYAWADWRKYFDPGASAEALRKTNNSHIIHVWNDVSKNVKVKVGSAAAYCVIAEQKCPQSYRASGEYF